MSWWRDATALLPLSESCLVCGRRAPRFVCFALSGSLCNVAQLGIDRLLLLLLVYLERADAWWVPTACWTSSYTLSVGLRHASHSVLVFGPSADPWCYALGKTYCTYVSTIIASTVLNLLLVTVCALLHCGS